MLCFRLVADRSEEKALELLRLAEGGEEVPVGEDWDVLVALLRILKRRKVTAEFTRHEKAGAKVFKQDDVFACVVSCEGECRPYPPGKRRRPHGKRFGA